MLYLFIIKSKGFVGVILSAPTFVEWIVESLV